MAVSPAETQSSDSHSHPSGFKKLKDDNDQNCPQFQDTEPFDEAVVPESPMMEDTQVVYYSDCDEKMRTGVSGFEEEVVLDSEDEEVNGSRLVTVRTMPSDICAAGLSYADSQEPGEESQANALDFVDQFVSVNDDMSFDFPGIDIRKTAKVKSPPVACTKGTQSLARMVELRSQNEIAKAFEWVDLPDDGALRFLDKKMESSLVNPKGKVQSDNVARKEKVRHANETKSISSGDGSKQKRIIKSLNKDITESEGKIGNESVNAPEDHLTERPTDMQLEPSEEGGDMVDMFDIGFNTQMAAEAMEALAYGGHPGCNIVDAGSGGATENRAHIEHCSLEKSDFSNVGGISKNVNRRNRSTRIPRKAGASSQTPSKKQQLYPDLAAASYVKKSRFFGESCSNPAEANNNLCTESPKSMKKRKLQSAIDYSKGGSGKHQTTDSMLGGGSRRMDDDSNNGIVTYRRKKRSLNAQSLEMISSSEAGSGEPVEKKNSVKKDDIVTYKRKKRKAAKESPVYVSSEGNSSSKACSLKLGLHSHPKGKRTGRNARQSSCRAPVPSTPFLLLDKDSSRSDERPERSNSMAGKEQSSYNPPVGCLNNNSDRILLELQPGKLVGTDPTCSGAECTAPSNSTAGINMGSSKYVSHDYHKKQCNKNLPKSSLIRELSGLGVSESLPDITWKDLRRRRSMAYVQVLFSQHLDDNIIKQQKKIIARLGLSLASCSMDATHFIADQFARTRNMLEFIALGKPVVTHLWLESCGEANCLISEKSYILRDAKKEKEFGFNMLVSLDSAKRCPLLKGRKVFITPNIKPGKEMMTSLVKTAQGEPVEKARMSTAKGKKILNELLILSCEEDEAICLPFLEKGVAVYNSELLLNGIVTQRLEYNRHQLFTDVVKKVRP